ncbi:putative F-box protein At1g32420 [Cornus florida]|uniref:putative F-box protein At1g32420 n=1 Tax=Cornus florida TaxID=4283 RepID=UPI00289E5BE7|nr:putative F-box protein At1g32420 [Cornus florida]
MASKSDSPHMFEDLTIEILSRLPLKSLLRFKCVSKYLYSLIRSNTFINKHLQRHGNNGRLLVKHYNYDTTAYTFALYPDETLAGFPLVYYDVDNIHMPHDPRIFDYCDGILCLWNLDRMALWNPATREFTFIPMPQPNVPDNFCTWSNFGFGLDPTTNDYKLVWIRRYFDSEKLINDYASAIISVYYLSTCSWRLFEADLSWVHYVHLSSCSTCLNGLYYWLTSDHDRTDTQDFCYDAIIYFDFSNEVFGEIPGPQDIPVTKVGNLIIYNDSISITFFYPHDPEIYIDLWVMKKEGCWTKELTIGPLVDVERALGFWKNGELFIETRSNSELVLYNPNTQDIKYFGHRGRYIDLQIFMYKESLVSIKGENECPKGHNVSSTARFQDYFTSDPPIWSDQTVQH